MEGNNSQKSTATYPTSSTISRTYDSTMPPPSHQVRFTPTAANVMRSSQSSKKNASASKPSSSLLTASTRTTGKSSSSTRNQRSFMRRTGEHSHGDHSWTGNSCNCRTCHQQNDSRMGKPASSNKRVRLSAADYFDDDKLRNVEDIYGEGSDDVYNNIN